MRTLLRITLALAAMALLSGCVNTELNESPSIAYSYTSPQQRYEQLKKVVAWRNSGAFSVKVDNKLNSANFIWEQSSHYNYRINISSALNIKSFTMIGNYHSVTLWTTETKEYSARKPEQVMQKELGWSIPVSNLYFWIRDIPAPGVSQDRQYDKYGHLRYFRQNGWQIRYTSYVTKNGVDYPVFVELFRPNIYIRIVIKHWLPYIEPMYGTTINEIEKKV